MRPALHGRIRPALGPVLALVLALASALALTPVLLGGASARADVVIGPFRSGHGITVESAQQASSREWRLVVSTGAHERPVPVDLLQPAG